MDDDDDDSNDNDDDDSDEDFFCFLTSRRAVGRVGIGLPENCSKWSGCPGDQNEHFNNTFDNKHNQFFEPPQNLSSDPPRQGPEPLYIFIKQNSIRKQSW